MWLLKANNYLEQRKKEKKRKKTTIFVCLSSANKIPRKNSTNKIQSNIFCSILPRLLDKICVNFVTFCKTRF